MKAPVAAKIFLCLFFWVTVAQSQTPMPDSGTNNSPAGSPGEILSSLTLEEKVGQLFIIYHGPPQFMAEHGFGGSLVFESMVARPDTLRASITQAQQLCKIPLLVAIDQEGGEINRLRPMPGLENTPGAVEMGLMSGEQVAAAIRPMAQAMLDLGLNLNLAPVVDPARDRHGHLTLMGQRGRAFGSSASEITPAALAVMEGFRGQGIGSIVKHFPGYVVQPNSDHELARCSANPDQIETNIIPFTRTVPQASGVMMSSIIFTAKSNVPAVLDPYWVVRSRCGQIDCLVMTDDLWGGALRKWVSNTPTVEPVDYPPEDLRRLVLLAFDAGNDMLMVTFPRKAVQMKAILVEAISQDSERQASLEESVLRILKTKARLGLF